MGWTRIGGQRGHLDLPFTSFMTDLAFRTESTFGSSVELRMADTLQYITQHHNSLSIYTEPREHVSPNR
jgi:hypothetical protein